MFQNLRTLFSEQREVFQSTDRITFLVGLGATFVYAFGALQMSAMELWGHNLMVLAFVVALFRAPREARTDPVVVMFGVTMLLGVFSYAQTHLLIPQYAETEPSFNKLFAVFIFFPIAFWLRGDMRRVLVLLSLALIGFGLAVLSHASWHDLRWLRIGGRTSFGLGNAQHTAMFFSVALIGWSVFSYRFLLGGRLAALRYVIWAVVFGLLLSGVVVAQTRAAWLGLAAALLAAAVFAGARVRRNPVVLKMLAVVVLTTVALGWVGWHYARQAVKPALERRSVAEHTVVRQAMTGEVDSLPDSSVGVRIKLWHEAIGWVKQRPLTGWGFEIRERFIKESQNLPEGIRDRFGHAHNSYLEILLIYGAAGILVFGALIVVISRRLWKSWRAGEIPNDVALFGACFFAFWVVVNVFESYIFGKTGTYLVAIVAGCAYTFPLAARLRGAAHANGGDGPVPGVGR